jgi:hypothetical protein
MRGNRAAFAPFLALLFGLAGALGAGAQGTAPSAAAASTTAAPSSAAGPNAAPSDAAAGAVQGAAPQAPAGPAAPARSFHGVELGMDLDSAIAALKKDPIFSYRGPEDLSLLPSPNQSLIEVEGLSFVRRGYFQFYQGKLWAIILELNPDKVDHFSVYTSLVAKYGDPTSLDPKECRWEDKTTRMALERPLSLRYMDMTVYGRLSEGASAKESVQELDRRSFLGGL